MVSEMFTGLIETIGSIQRVQTIPAGKTFEVSSRFQGEPLSVGESLAVDGVCVTVEAHSSGGFKFTASSETLQRSTLAELRSADRVHLERALRLGDRLGGHFVQGHVDGVGLVNALIPKGQSLDLSVQIPPELISYIALKGSLAVKGVSLTVARLEAGIAGFAVIPETLRRTCLGELKPGQHINLEVDILAKYVESLLSRRSQEINEEKLRGWGFG